MNQDDCESKSESVMRSLGFVFEDPTDIILTEDDFDEDGENYDISKCHERIRSLDAIPASEQKDAFVAIGKAVVALLMFAMLSGCSFNYGQKLVYVHDKFPTYPIVEEPVLKDISGDEINPQRKVVGYVNIMMEDGAITPAEIERYNNAIEEANSNAANCKDKVIYNTDELRRWGRKNEATLREYDAFKDRMNSRVPEAQE